MVDLGLKEILRFYRVNRVREARVSRYLRADKATYRVINNLKSTRQFVKLF